jgi:hypothetical protein
MSGKRRRRLAAIRWRDHAAGGAGDEITDVREGRIEKAEAADL